MREEGDLARDALAPTANLRWAAGVAQVHPQAAALQPQIERAGLRDTFTTFYQATNSGCVS